MAKTKENTLSGWRKTAAIAAGGLAALVSSAALPGCQPTNSPIVYVRNYTSEHKTPDRDKILKRYSRAEQMSDSKKEVILEFFNQNKNEIEKNEGLQRLKNEMPWIKEPRIEYLSNEDKLYLYLLANEDAGRLLFP